MIRLAYIFVGIVGVLSVVDCYNTNMTIEEIYDFAQNVLNATEKWQHSLKEQSADGRKSKFLPFGLLPFHALWGFGGLNALAILFAVKFKIIIIVSIVAFSVYYYTKFAAIKKCSSDNYREGEVYSPGSSYSGSAYYGAPLTAYSSPFVGDISSHNFEPYSGYHDSPIHTDIPSYTFDHEHHNHHDHHDFSHHSADFGHFVPDHTSSHTDTSPASTPKDTDNDVAPSMSNTYRRVGRHRRKRANKQTFDFIDLGELAFRFLGVNTEGCRRRFVCELDFRAQANPVARLAFTFIGKNFFERYRASDENVTKLKKFADCAKVFNDCEEAEKYNNIPEEHEKINSDNDAKEVENDDTDQHDDPNDSPNDKTEENKKEKMTIQKDTDKMPTKRNRKIAQNYIINRRISII